LSFFFFSSFFLKKRFAASAEVPFSEKIAEFEDEWEAGANDREIFKFSEDGEQRKTKEEIHQEMEDHGGFATTNPRYEFLPHVKSMDQFHM
jgi:hypothetical protein